MKVSFIIAFILLIAGCATPYQKWGDGALSGGGYREWKLAENEYQVEFRGNGHSKLEDVIQKWNRRALELCPNGFTIKDETARVEQATGTVVTYAAGGITSRPLTGYEVPSKIATIKCNVKSGS